MPTRARPQPPERPMSIPASNPESNRASIPASNRASIPESNRASIPASIPASWVSTYLRPLTLDDAIESLSRPGAVLIGGGTKVNPVMSSSAVVIIDLQALDLDRLDAKTDGRYVLGATATLQDLADHSGLPVAVRDAARREAPSTLRTLSTVAGCVATADPDSELLAALLVHDAQVSLAGRDGAHGVELPALLADRGRLADRIITAVTIRTDGVASAARTGRTRADRAIVAAVARRTPAGAVRLAVTGMGAGPLLLEPTVDLAAAMDQLDPPDDFRGSPEFRRLVAAVLARRVLGEVGA